MSPSLAKGAPDLMQRLPAFQRRQISVLCVAEGLARFPSLINTISKQKIYLMVLHRPTALTGKWVLDLSFTCPNPKVKERLVLTSLRSRVILRVLDTLVDIGVPAEKEVIQ